MTPLATAPGAACAAPPARGLSRARARATPPPPGPRPLLLPKRRVALRAARLAPLGRRPPLSLAPPTPPRAAGDSDTGSLLDELDADARCPVPVDQRPASQLRELQESLLLGWGGLDQPGYLARLGLLGAFFYFVLAKPIANYSYDPATQPLEAIVCALTGSFVAVAAFALLIYNNWSYVRDRLLSATVEYEETGWYDGQTYVKDPEMLARDRLLGTYTVRPIVERLRKTLLACGVGVFASLAALSYIAPPEYGVDGRDYYENGGAGFSRASADFYEPELSPEEEAAEEAEELERYERAMERYRSDQASAREAAREAVSEE